MITVIYRGQRDDKVGKLTFKGAGELNHFSEEEWNETYSKYKGYFDKRTHTDENPNGQYIISGDKTESLVKKKYKEVGVIKVDNSQEAIDKSVERQMEEISPELAETYREVKKENKAKKKKRGRKKRAEEVIIDMEEVN